MAHFKRSPGLPHPAVDEPVDDEAEPNADLSWEAEVLCRIAPLLAEVRRRAAQDADVLGWEAAGVRRLAQVTGGEF